MAITVVLVEPRTAGNVGAIARAMKNFGMTTLILVNPKCDHLGKESQDRAKHAKDILSKAKVMTLKEARSKLHVLVGTTARTGDQYNFQRIPMLPAQLNGTLATLSPQTEIGIVFGRETDGLTNEEIGLCDFTVTIPTDPSYKSLNVSHAAAIVLSHLFVPEKNILEKYTPLAAKEKEQAIKLIDGVIDTISFPTPHMVETQKILWRKIIGKSFLTKREGYALMGFMRKVGSTRPRKKP